MVREQLQARTIVRNPRILFRKSTIEGTRISVRTVGVLNYARGGDAQRVQEELPTLSVADAGAALQSYGEHRDEINTYYRREYRG